MNSNILNFYKYNIFLYLHIFTISWSAVLRLSDWTPIPLIIFMLAVFYELSKIFLSYLSGRQVYLRFNPLELFILIGLLLIYLNVFFNPTPKSINYLLAYSTVFGLYAIFLTVNVSKFPTNSLLKTNYIAINFICIFIILEVFGKSFFGFDIFEWIPRTKDATALAAPGLFRAYGLSTEPTQVGNYFAVFLPYAIFYRARVLGKGQFLYLLFISFSSILLFSAAFFAVIFISLLFLIAFSKQRLRLVRNIVGIVITFSFLVIVLAINYNFLDVLINASTKITEKLFLTSDGSSVYGRLGALQDGIYTIASNPFFGTGLGHTSSLGSDSSINWYVYLSSEVGIFTALVLFLWFISHFVVSIINYLNTSETIFLCSSISLLGGLSYFVFVSTFQNMFLFTSLIFLRIIIKNFNEKVIDHE